MSMITVCQVDKNNVVVGDAPYTRQVPCQGHLQVLVALPEIPAGHTAQWSTTLDPVADTVTWGTEGTGTWETPEDHRKDTLWTAYQAQYTIGSEVGGQTYDGLGPVPAWLHADEPPLPLKDAKAAKIAELSAECATRITAGFESSALGAAHHYPANNTDQRNLASSVLASLIPDLPVGWTTPFWCADAAGDWAMRPHTAAQIQQVGQDGKAAILALMTKNEALAQQVNAVTDDATGNVTVEQITWPT